MMGKMLLWSLSIFFMLLNSNNVFCLNVTNDSIKKIEDRLDDHKRETDKKIVEIIKKYNYFRYMVQKTKEQVWLGYLYQQEREGGDAIASLIIEELDKTGSVEDAVFLIERLYNRDYMMKVINPADIRDYYDDYGSIILTESAVLKAFSQLATRSINEQKSWEVIKTSCFVKKYISFGSFLLHVDRAKLQITIPLDIARLFLSDIPDNSVKAVLKDYSFSSKISGKDREILEQWIERGRPGLCCEYFM